MVIQPFRTPKLKNDKEYSTLTKWISNKYNLLTNSRPERGIRALRRCNYQGEQVQPSYPALRPGQWRRRGKGRCRVRGRKQDMWWLAVGTSSPSATPPTRNACPQAGSLLEGAWILDFWIAMVTRGPPCFLRFSFYIVQSDLRNSSARKRSFQCRGNGFCNYPRPLDKAVIAGKFVNLKPLLAKK